MIDISTAPSLSDSTGVFADWVELQIIYNGYFSLYDIISYFRLLGPSYDYIDENDDEHDPDKGSVISQQRADEVFQEIESRFSACGNDTAIYPFFIEKDNITFNTDKMFSAYIFLLILSNTFISKDICKFFEIFSAEAAVSYIGGYNQKADKMVIGFPRIEEPKGLEEALKLLCTRLGEGVGPKTNFRYHYKKDNDIDLITWKHFHDNYEGKLICLGQCATGNNWREKINDLCISSFSDMLIETPAVPPVKMFFTPYRIRQSQWRDICIRAGIVFDRCRIASHMIEINDNIRSKMVSYISSKLHDKSHK